MILELVARPRPATTRDALRLGIASVCSLAAGLVAAGPGAPPAAASAAVQLHRFEDSARSRDYWTRGRLEAAQPLDLPISPTLPTPIVAAESRVSPMASRRPRYFAGSPPSPSQRLAGPRRVHGGVDRDRIDDPTPYPFRTHGRVFGRLPGIGDYSCSATVVSSNTDSVIVTAGHCLYYLDSNGRGHFASRFIFVPAFDEGERPYGTWAGLAAAVPSHFLRSERLTSDVAAVELAKQEDEPIGEVVGSRGIAFDVGRDQGSIGAFGYPATAPFDGDDLYRCTSPYSGDDPRTASLGGPPTMRILCDMTAGSSGGGWVVREGKNPAVKPGFVYSLISYSYQTAAETNHLYGPYLSTEARRAWALVQNNCGGLVPTISGTAEADHLVGTPHRDIILGFGGNDQIDGRGGNDRICGGDGADRIEGSYGDDSLLGDRDGDTLLGGPQDDDCSGGEGIDRANGCESATSTP